MILCVLFFLVLYHAQLPIYFYLPHAFLCYLFLCQEEVTEFTSSLLYVLVFSDRITALLF